MSESAKQDLESRRGEILKQLERVNADLRIELDRDAEEQAIEIEQDEVAINMESQLRRELAEIEEKLGELRG